MCEEKKFKLNKSLFFPLVFKQFFLIVPVWNSNAKNILISSTAVSIYWEIWLDKFPTADINIFTAYTLVSCTINSINSSVNSILK